MESHRAAAGRALREYVQAKRTAAQAAAQQAVLAAANGHPSHAHPHHPVMPVRDLPDFMIAFLVYVLANHPDFPDTLPPGPALAARGEGEAGGEQGGEDQVAALQPFSLMMQALLEPLLTARGPSGGGGAGGGVSGGAVSGGRGGGQAAAEQWPVVKALLKSIKMTEVAEVSRVVGWWWW